MPGIAAVVASNLVEIGMSLVDPYSSLLDGYVLEFTEAGGGLKGEELRDAGHSLASGLIRVVVAGLSSLSESMIFARRLVILGILKRGWRYHNVGVSSRRQEAWKLEKR